MIPIDSGVPIPPRKSTPKKYPWAEMKVGDAFFAPGVKSCGGGPSSGGRKWTIRVLDGGVRVWRIA